MKKLFTQPGLFFLLAVMGLLSVFACNKSNPVGINAQSSTLSFVLANASNSTIFHSAVLKAGLDTVFNSPSMFTLFVPTDPACIQSGFSLAHAWEAGYAPPKLKRKIDSCMAARKDSTVGPASLNIEINR